MSNIENNIKYKYTCSQLHDIVNKLNGDNGQDYSDSELIDKVRKSAVVLFNRKEVYSARAVILTQALRDYNDTGKFNFVEEDNWEFKRNVYIDRLMTEDGGIYVYIKDVLLKNANNEEKLCDMLLSWSSLFNTAKDTFVNKYNG